MILLRHGQSEFNLHFTRTKRDPGIVDPKLTGLGHQQAIQAAEALCQEKVARIIVSPYTRTLQTAAYLADRLKVALLVNPIVRERFAFACDIGSPRTELTLAWPCWDFSSLDEIWWPAITESAASVLGRAALFRAEMIALDDWPDTIVVTHWGFIMSMTGLNVPNGQWLRVDPHASPPVHIPWG
jgi:broad specificity phosphatase PhoE